MLDQRKHRHTFCLIRTSWHSPHLQWRYSQKGLCPFRAVCTPWFLQWAHLGFLVAGFRRVVFGVLEVDDGCFIFASSLFFSTTFILFSLKKWLFCWRVNDVCEVVGVLWCILSWQESMLLSSFRFLKAPEQPLNPFILTISRFSSSEHIHVMILFKIFDFQIYSF